MSEPAATEKPARPSAVITFTEQDGDQLGIKCEFFPSAPTTGPLPPAHSVAARVLRLLTEMGDEE